MDFCDSPRTQIFEVELGITTYPQESVKSHSSSGKMPKNVESCAKLFSEAKRIARNSELFIGVNLKRQR
jgi:hypothetical protein